MMTNIDVISENVYAALFKCSLRYSSACLSVIQVPVMIVFHKISITVLTALRVIQVPVIMVIHLIINYISVFLITEYGLLLRYSSAYCVIQVLFALFKCFPLRYSSASSALFKCFLLRYSSACFLALEQAISHIFKGLRAIIFNSIKLLYKTPFNYIIKHYKDSTTVSYLNGLHSQTLAIAG